MAARSDHHRVSWRYIAQLAILAAAYVLTGRLGLQLAQFHETATLIWAPTGLSLAALLLFGLRLWPGVFVGALVVNLAVGTSPLLCLAIASGNSLEAVLGTWLLRRSGHFEATLSRSKHVLSLVLIGGCLCTLVSASVGLTALSLAGEVPAGDSATLFLIWWLGDLGGAVVVAPLLLLARHGTPAWKQLLLSLEFWCAAAGLTAVCTVAFGGHTLGPWSLLAAFLPFPFLIWAGSRLGSRGAIMASGVTALIATIGTSQGQGPFVTGDALISQLLLLAYMTTVGGSAMALASANSQRDHAERRRRLEAERRLGLERRMNQTQRLEGLGTLAGGIAHDFNNILGVISANAELLAEDIEGNDEASLSIKSIEEAARRAADLCNRLMAYAGQRPPANEPVSLVDVAEGTVSMLAASISKKVTLRTVLSGTAPCVDGDMTLLRQVLMNLVLNGAEAMGDGVGIVEVLVGTQQLSADELSQLITAPKVSPGTFAYLEVTDSGSGIDKETAERMFEPFFTTKPGGRGLGLAAVLGIVRSHGGAISVHGEPGHGTSIRMYLPLLGTASRSPPLQSTSPSMTPVARDQDRWILLADDEPQLLMVTAKILEKGGHRVLCVADGAAAVKAHRERSAQVKLALLDVTMPKLTGVEAMHAIRKREPKTPVLLMSGFGAEDTDEISAGDGFLAKPFSAQELLLLVDRTLDRASGQDDAPYRPQPSSSDPAQPAQ